MLRKALKRAFTSINKQPQHVKNAKNDHYLGVYEKFQQNFDHQVKDDFQKFYYDRKCLERNQIQTRILKVLYDSELIQRLDKFSFNQDMRKELSLDSLNVTVLLTSIEHEFTTVFEDRVFETVRNLQQIVTLLCRDQKIL